MPRHIIRTALSTLAAAAAVIVLSPGTASARTIYQEYATVVSTSPPSNASCSYVISGREVGGQACFTPDGDQFWIRDLRADGLHVEMRAQVNTTGDGFRCYTYRGSSYPWQRCDSFWDEIPENGTVIYTASLWDGTTQRSVGSLRMARAS
jgi:hypothetical protein